MITLKQLVASQTLISEELPLVHTTRCEVLPHIVANHELRSPLPCDVFHEHLIYFFYGRPAYRYVLGRAPGGGIELCPVCFIFKPHTIGNRVKRVFACDSGGVEGGCFRPHLQPPDRDEMQLDNTLDSARKLVPLVFGTNEKYFLGNASKPAPTSFLVGSAAYRFHMLLTDSAMRTADDRRSAIEVQLPSPVSLDHHLLYIVLPNEVLDRSDVRQAILEIWQCDPIGYDVYMGDSPNSYASIIREKLKQRYEEAHRL
jgi:hypothetical protein